jgi:4-amino-4-deoxy-L-arabinose transferase-like glycosyltransferase
MGKVQNRLHANTAWVIGVCLIAAGLRCFHIDAPLADNLQAKQAYSSNKARNIARAPFDPMRLSLDLLDDSGRAVELAEEVPLYIGLLGAMFAAWGESVIWGRALSIAGSLIALVAFFDLTRREHGERVARVGVLLLACAPLFVFYGRAIMPDSWMLAMMLTTAASFRRYLENRKLRWLVLACVAGALTGLFKYWGLMIVPVVADMVWRDRGRLALFRLDFLALAASIVLPTVLWIAFVFAPAPNPVQVGWVTGQPASPYLVLQQPSALWNRSFYAAFVSRFLVRDCGPITAALLVAGVWLVVRRAVPVQFDARSLARWSVMGLLFYVLLAPKMIDHDYYELMMLPAAVVWASLGWLGCCDGLAKRAELTRFVSIRRLAGVSGSVVLALVVAVHSPWVSPGLFRLETGKVWLGNSLREATQANERVVAIGPGIALIVPLHYSGRTGWAVRATELPTDWPAQIERWRRLGATTMGVYFDAKTKPAQRASYQPLIDSLRVIERVNASDIASKRGEGFEYVVLSLEGRGPDSTPSLTERAGDAGILR